MPNNNGSRALHGRLYAFLVVAGAYALGSSRLGWGVQQPGKGPAPVAVTDPILAVYLVSVLLGFLLMRARRIPHATALGLVLALDAIAIGVLGACLRFGSVESPFLPEAVPFLLGYVPAILMAVIGRRRVAAELGAVAGTLIFATGTWMVAGLQSEFPPIAIVTLQVVLLLTGTLETGFVACWVGEEADRAKVAELLEREVQRRESESHELVAFAQALAASGTVAEVADSVLRHLRQHLAVQVRAVVTEAKGEVAAVWEEPFRFDPQIVQNRREYLQDTLVRIGSPIRLERLDVRSLGGEAASPDLHLHSRIEIPVTVSGRNVGVLLVADPRRHAVDPSRIGLLADVARRVGDALQRIERRSDEEQRRTALLLQQMREGVLLLGTDGDVVLANPAAREALRASETSPDAPPALGSLSLEDLAATPSGVTRRFRAELRPAGSHRPVILACTAVGILDAGKRMGTLVTVSDVTEEELARGRLVQSEKMTLVGQTLAGVAHELNNPLAALIGYADILEGRNVPTELEKPIRQMREQALRAARIVRNLLGFAKRRNPERTPTALGELVQAVVELFAYEIRLNDISILVDLQPDLPTVLGDKHALQQVLVNLVQNAIHALQERPGGRRIEIAARAVPDGLVTTVRDSGGGVPKDLRTRIFEPFFTTKGAAKGTGLGLALSRTIAREHGGDLVLEPDDGGGACFTLHLPLPRVAATLPVAAVAGGETARTASVGPFHVLVVDDEPAVRDSLVAQLGKLGCRVDSASSAAEAHRQILRDDYDAVLLDVRMPGGTGLELFQRIAGEKPATASRIVFMSGDFTNEGVVAGIRETGNAFLEKPFTLDELAQALHGRPGAPTIDKHTARTIMIGANR